MKLHARQSAASAAGGLSRQSLCVSCLKRFRPLLLPLVLAIPTVQLLSQVTIPPVPSEPLLPTDDKECEQFRVKYQKVINAITEAISKCITLDNIYDKVAAPSSCLQWSKGNSLGQTSVRACYKLDDRKCRAFLDEDKKLTQCLAEVKENRKKKEVIQDALKVKKPDRPKAKADDEIDTAFDRIKASNVTTKNEAISGYQEKGIDTIGAMEKQNFAELDKAFKQADEAELQRAEHPAPPVRLPTPPHPVQQRDQAPTVANTTWSVGRNDPNMTQNPYNGSYTETIHFHADGTVTQEVGDALTAAERHYILEGTWTQTSNGVQVIWRVSRTPSYCGSPVHEDMCQQSLDGDTQVFTIKNGKLVRGEDDEYSPN